MISVRIRCGTLEKIEKLVAESNRSRNEVINILLADAVENAEIED